MISVLYPSKSRLCALRSPVIRVLSRSWLTGDTNILNELVPQSHTPDHTSATLRSPLAAALRTLGRHARAAVIREPRGAGPPGALASPARPCIKHEPTAPSGGRLTSQTHSQGRIHVSPGRGRTRIDSRGAPLHHALRSRISTAFALLWVSHELYADSLGLFVRTHLKS